MKHNPIDKLMLFLVAFLVCGLALLNICQTDRPTVSELENRNLATMPEFSISSLLDGSYFSDVMTFFSDTFYAREGLVKFSQKLDSFKGLAVFFGESDFSIIIDPNASSGDTTDGPIQTLPPMTDPPTKPTTKPTNPTDPTGPSDSTGPVIPLTLSADTIALTVGTSQQLSATVAEGFTNLRWESSDENTVFVTDLGRGVVTVSGLAAGSATVSATVTDADGQTHSVTCTVTVTEPNIEKPDDQPAEFLPNGLFIYNGAAYSQSYFSSTYAPYFAAVYDRYATMFPGTRVNVVTAPLATITITDPKVLANITDQGKILDQMEASMPDSVNFVNMKNIMLAHADEYLYFRSDHHWTHRGAYYAYYAFAQSVGLDPVPIEEFEKKELTDKYIGSMYSYTGDDRVKYFYDTVEAYMPTKDCTMTIYNTAWGTLKRNYCIDTGIKNYLAFLMGDYGYTVINVPENPQDMTCLVIKDSYGNAFVPYLTEHYGNIIVIDLRYISIDLYEEFKGMHLTDIIFMTNTSSANSSAWYNYFLNAIS